LTVAYLSTDGLAVVTVRPCFCDDGYVRLYVLEGLVQV
jgi:hypothetical protein